MTEWKTYRLGDILNFRRGHDLPKTQMVDGKIPVAGSNGIIGYHNVSTPIEPCITIGRSGNVGTPYIYDRCWAHNTVLYIDDFKGNDPLYLYYLLKTIPLASYGGGSAVPTLNRNHIHPIEIKHTPSLEEQRRIAGILSAIDDKIENNRRINTNLELQAQALYKQWFVDNRRDDWEIKPLSEIAEFIGGYSYKGNELVEASSTAMATIKNFERKGGFKVEGFKDIVASSKLKAEQHAELFDILVAHTDLTQNADVIGNAEILLTFGGYTDVIFSMDLVKVLPKSNFPYKYLLAALLKNPYFKAHCLGYVNGTTVLHMSKKALPEYVVACPPNSEAEKMDMAFKVYYHKMAEILQENKTLATLRDTLLPKLMNGEIKM